MNLRVAFYGALLWTAAVVPVASADGLGDGLYGRFDGDVAVSAGVGTALDAEEGSVGFHGDMRGLFLDAAGLWAAGTLRPSAARVLTGVELRPLFPTLFLLDQSLGWKFWDLVLQSVGIELGVVWQEPLTQDGGVGLVIGARLEIPVLLPHGHFGGVWLRGGIRHLHAGPSDLAGPDTALSAWTVHWTVALKGTIRTGLLRR